MLDISKMSVAQMKELSAIISGPADGPSEEAIQWLKDNPVGTPVKILGRSDEGTTAVVAGLNNRNYGMYNGGRYPIYVRLSGDSIPVDTEPYEYSLDQIIVLDK